MTAGITYYHALPVKPPVERVLLRLGYKKSSGLPPEDVVSAIDRFASRLRVCGAFLRVPITGTLSPGSVFLGDGTAISSEGLFALLDGCLEAAFLGASVPDAPALVAERFGANAADEAVILDAVAAQCADAGLDSILSIQGALIRHSGLGFTRRRFSPGYGDVALSFQKTIFDRLMLGNLGMSIDERSFMLSPEKSVLAVAGVQTIA
ncbi:MAG: hypothetical protein ACOX8O_00130 [Christensenellales bacterium]|jgi:hypothetical protein